MNGGNNFQFDFFRLPRGFGGLECDGDEDNITSCSVCEGPSQYYEGQELEYEFGPPPPPVYIDIISDDGSLPGVGCCDQYNEFEPEAVTISCLGIFPQLILFLFVFSLFLLLYF